MIKKNIVFSVVFFTLIISNCAANSLYRFEFKGKYGYVDESYKVVIPAKYDSASEFFDNIAVVGEDSIYKVIDSSGKILKRFYYDIVYPFKNGFAVFKQNDQFGIIDLKGTRIITNCWRISNFSEGFAAVALKPKKWNFIDTTGKIVFPIFFQYAQSFSDGLAAVRDSETEKWGFINKMGDYEISPQYDDIAPGEFRYGHCIVIKNESCFLINKQNKIVLNIKQKNSFIVGPNLFASGVDYILAGNYNLMTFKGEVIKENFADTITSFYEGFAFFKSNKNKKYGIIDTKGNLLSGPIFSEVGFFTNGRAFIVKDGQGGFIDTKGKITWVKDFIK